MKILGLQYLFDRCVDEEKIIIFGCGKAGQEILKQLHDKGIDPLAVFSNNPLNDQNNANDVHVQIPSNKFEGLKPLYVIAVIKEDYCYEMKKQLHSFTIAVDKAKELLGDIKYIHAAASNALINYPEARFNLVRPGIIIYGYAGADDTFEKIDLNYLNYSYYY